MTSNSDNPLNRVLVVGMVRVTEAAAVAGTWPIFDHTKSLIFLECGQRLYNQLLHFIG